MTWQSWVSVIKDILTGLAALTGIGVALAGLKAWRRQLRGKTDYELARRLLRAVYKVREAIRSVRNPLILEGEMDNSLRQAGVSSADLGDRELHAKSQAAVYQLRWKEVSEAVSDVDVELLEAEVSWGNEIRERIRPLRTCITTLNVSIWRYLRQLSNPDAPNKMDVKTYDEIHSVIYRRSPTDDPEEDPFAAEVKNAVEGIETFLKPHLKI